MVKELSAREKMERSEYGAVRLISQLVVREFSHLLYPDGNLAQTITHPTISVWVVDVLPNGDIISGASDGMVRVWTRSEERKASADEVRQLDQAVASRQLNKWVECSKSGKVGSFCMFTERRSGISSIPICRGQKAWLV